MKQSLEIFLAMFTVLRLAFFCSASVGIIFGLWPAQQAAALNPIRALRYE